MSAAAQPTEVLTLSDLAREALAQSDGIIEAAVNDLGRQLQGDADLLLSVVEQAVYAAVEVRTRGVMRGDRRAIIHRATNEKANVYALAKGLAASLLDMPLGNGSRLRACDRATVQRESERYDGLSRDCGRKARFLAAIAQSVPPGKTVGDVVSDARATELWKDVG